MHKLLGSAVRLLVVVFATGLAACALDEPRSDQTLNNAVFSRDGSRVFFFHENFTTDPPIHSVGYLDLDNGQFYRLAPPETEYWVEAAPSPDGSQLVAVSHPRTPEGGIRRDEQHLVLLSMRTLRYRRITGAPYRRAEPRFSSDGNTVYFLRPDWNGYFSDTDLFGRVKPKRRFSFADWNVWQIDVRSGAEARLTDCEFFYLHNLLPLQKNREFFVAVLDPRWRMENVVVNPLDKMAFLREGHCDSGPVPPAIFDSFSRHGVRAPVLIERDGAIAFEVTNWGGGPGTLGSHIVRFEPDQRFRFLYTAPENTYVFKFAVSPDGKRYFVTLAGRWRPYVRAYVTVEDGGGVKEIAFPEHPGDWHVIPVRPAVGVN